MSAEMVASSGRTDVAAIASRSCATLYGLEVLESNIQDSDNNYTRFVVISREPRVYPGANRTSLMITTANEPGALYRVLERFYALNINLIKLESRPIPGSDFEFMFYFDLDCPFGSKALDDLLDSIDDVCESFTYLSLIHIWAHVCVRHDDGLGAAGSGAHERSRLLQQKRANMHLEASGYEVSICRCV